MCIFSTSKYHAIRVYVNVNSKANTKSSRRNNTQNAYISNRFMYRKVYCKRFVSQYPRMRFCVCELRIMLFVYYKEFTLVTREIFIGIVD